MVSHLKANVEAEITAVEIVFEGDRDLAIDVTVGGESATVLASLALQEGEDAHPYFRSFADGNTEDNSENLPPF